MLSPLIIKNTISVVVAIAIITVEYIRSRAEEPYAEALLYWGPSILNRWQHLVKWGQLLLLFNPINGNWSISGVFSELFERLKLVILRPEDQVSWAQISCRGPLLRRYILNGWQHPIKERQLLLLLHSYNSINGPWSSKLDNNEVDPFSVKFFRFLGCVMVL